jgi:FkbM family methyltransferase
VRILLAHNSPYYPSCGGGDRSNRILMEGLAARGHAVRVVARVAKFGAEAERALLEQLALRRVWAEETDGAAIRIELNGVDVRILSRDPRLRAYFASEIREFDPDVIVASTDDPAHLLLDIALRAERARVVYLVRATVAAPFGPDSAMPSAARTEALRRTDGVVAVSEFVAQYARRWAGLDAVHVPISLLEPGDCPCLGRFENHFVTMVNPCAVKGISIFLALAERLPQTEFAAIPTWGTTVKDLAALERLPNVSILQPVDNFDDLLRQTRVVLTPSLWAEARSRVILEAMSRGVPVIASDVGGLAEAKLGVDYLLPVNPVVRYRREVDELMVPVAEIPEQDAGPWQAALERLLSDRPHYEQLSRDSRDAALAYARDLTVLPFESYLRNVLRSPARRQAAAPSPRAPRDAALSAGKRTLLARRATARAREAVPGADLEVLWDGMWIVRAGPYYFPAPGLFDADGPHWLHWTGMAEKCLRDAEDYWFHVYKPKPGDVILDIGAGRGADTFAFSRAVGGTGCVWAIEPHPLSFAALQKLCAWNRLTSVTPLPYACVDAPASFEIETLPVWESSYLRKGAPAPTSCTVEGVPLDTLCASHGIERIDYLKMNIEGAERLALPGATAALRRARFATVAAHDFRAGRGEGEEFRTHGLVRQFLTQAGFELLTRDNDPRYYVPYHVHGFRTK